MSSARIRLFTDEDIDTKRAPALRARGYCLEAGRSNRRLPDNEQLLYATLQGRAVLTFNAHDFVALAPV